MTKERIVLQEIARLEEEIKTKCREIGDLVRKIDSLKEWNPEG